MLTSPTYAPRLRRGLAAQPDRSGFVLFDQRRAGDPVHLSAAALELVKLFDGTVTLGELANATGLAVADLAALVKGLDEALLLDGPSWQAKVHAPVREPVCVGVYPEDADGVRRVVRSLFVGKGGAGGDALAVGSRLTGERLRAVLAPHMDYTRGNVTYGHAFRPLFEETAAKLFVVVGTSHYSPAPLTLSRQNFRTPLGMVQTDQAFIDRVVKHFGDGLFDDPAAHFPEHSIELELPFLQLLAEMRGKPIRIVPLLVGPVSDDLPRMAEALAKAEAEAGEPVCYVISGDLAHIGPKFDDPEPVDAEQLKASREQDEKLLKCLERADAAGYSQVIEAEDDARRICGHSPTVLTLLATTPARGRVTHYQQYAHPRGHESVSFAAAAFYG
jgi:AmmeMemoRadiSam system protein B